MESMLPEPDMRSVINGMKASMSNSPVESMEGIIRSVIEESRASPARLSMVGSMMSSSLMV